METKHQTIDSLLAEIQRWGRVEIKHGQLTLTGRFPRALLDELRERHGEALAALRQQPATIAALLPKQSPLLAALDDTPGIPRLTLTLHESLDVDGDVQVLRQLVALFEAHPGGNRAILTIDQLDGTRKRVQWRVHAPAALRRAVAGLLQERATTLGLVVDRRTGRCRRCGGEELAYDPHGRLFCKPCRLAAWRSSHGPGVGN